MSAVSKKFTEALSVLTLATAAALVPSFNAGAHTNAISDTSEIPTHPLVNLPGTAYWEALRIQAKEQVGYALQNNAAPVGLIEDAKLQANGNTAGFERVLSRVLAIDVAGLTKDYNEKIALSFQNVRHKTAFIYKFTPSDEGAKPYDLVLMAAVPKVGQEREDVPYCMELPQYDVNTKQWGRNAVIKTGRISADGNLLDMPWTGETKQIEVDGKLRMACKPFLDEQVKRLNECAAQGIKKGCFKSEKEKADE